MYKNVYLLFEETHSRLLYAEENNTNRHFVIIRRSLGNTRLHAV